MYTIPGYRGWHWPPAINNQNTPYCDELRYAVSNDIRMLSVGYLSVDCLSQPKPGTHGLFLKLNGYDLAASPEGKYKIIIRVAASDISEDELAQWIRKNLKEIKS